MLFYRQGISPEKIAELNGVPRNMVVDYLGRIRRHYPELVAGRLMLHDHPRPRPASASDPDRRWRTSLEQVATFIAEHGRRPYTTDYDTAEGPLAHWITTQRYKHRNGRLAEHRVRWLDESIPGWQTDTRSLHYEDQWNQRVADLQLFRAEHDRWPGYWLTEMALYRWLNDQRKALRAGAIRPDRRQILNRELPGWNTPRRGISGVVDAANQPSTSQ